MLFSIALGLLPLARMFPQSGDLEMAPNELSLAFMGTVKVDGYIQCMLLYTVLVIMVL